MVIVMMLVALFAGAGAVTFGQQAGGGVLVNPEDVEVAEPVVGPPAEDESHVAYYDDDNEVSASR